MGIMSLILGIIGIVLASTVIIINQVEIATIIVSLLGLVISIIGLILGIKVFKEKRKNKSKNGIEIIGIIICAVMTIILLAISGILIVVGYHVLKPTPQLIKR